MVRQFVGGVHKKIVLQRTIFLLICTMAGTEKIIKNVTGGFLIVGFFIPGFTLMGLLGVQMLISYLGVECANAWRVLWIATSICCVAWPILYGKFISKYYNTLATYNSRLKFKFGIVLFNIFELPFIQLTLGMFFTTGKHSVMLQTGKMD